MNCCDKAAVRGSFIGVVFDTIVKFRLHYPTAISVIVWTTPILIPSKSTS